MLQKVFEMIKQSSATTSYIYASRILGLAVREDIENYDANMLNSLAKYYINITKIDLQTFYHSGTIENIVKEHIDEITKERKNVQAKVRSYVKSKTHPKSNIFVDSTAYTFNA